MSAYKSPQSCGFNPANNYNHDGAMRFLRSKYGRRTCAQVSKDVGVSPRTVENWLVRRTAPSADHLVPMIIYYGPEFLEASSTAPADWVSQATLRWTKEQIDAEIARLERERANLNIEPEE